MEEDKSQKIEIRSEEVQDILGQVPSWIVRWGTVVILATILIILVGSMIFSYPDIIRADILVTTEYPPTNLKAREDGQIERFFVDDSQFVKINTHLAVIENAANYSDVISLRYDIEEIRTIIANLEEGEYIPLMANYTLGEIQSVYAEFINAYEDYYLFLKRDSHAKTIASIKEQIANYQTLNRGLNRQVRILERDFELAKRQYDRDKRLHTMGHVPDADLDKSEQNQNDANLELEKSRQDQTNNAIEISTLEQEIQNLELTSQEEKDGMENAVREAFAKLIAEIDIWENQYLLRAPFDGVVSRNKFWIENQNVKIGDNVMTIIPANPGEIIGKIDLPIEGSGKVDAGQTVNIQFVNFPHLQFGMVKGIIRTISQVPDEGLYVVDVELPEGLMTYYGKEIDFNQEMFGRAEIITDKRVLIQRIFSPIRSAITEQRETRKDVETNSQSE